MTSEKDTGSEYPRTREEYGCALNGELKDLLEYVIREAKSKKVGEEGACRYVSFLFRYSIMCS